MTTQQETMRRLINLLEAAEQKPSTDTDSTKSKVTQDSPEEERAAAKFAQTIAAISESLDEPLDEDWKKVAGALAVAGAALMSNLAHAQDPAHLIDTSSPIATAKSCAMILYATADTGKFDQSTTHYTRVLADKANTAAMNAVNYRPDRGQAWANDLNTVSKIQAQVPAKARQLIQSGNAEDLYKAATDCAKAVEKWNVDGYGTYN